MSNENQPHEVEKDQDSPNPDGKGFTRRRFIAGVAGAGMSIALAGNMAGQASAQEAQESGPSPLDKTKSNAPLYEPFIGDIIMVGFNFAPVGWALCNGQLLDISGNDALFSLIGTTYGGDGENTFALPDLRSRMPVHQGQGPGRSNRTLGDAAGVETVTLLTSQMPQHSHPVNAQSNPGNSTNPTNNYPAAASALDRMYSSSNNATRNPNGIGFVGGSQPHDNISPFLTINFIIALEGLYPSPN